MSDTIRLKPDFVRRQNTEKALQECEAITYAIVSTLSNGLIVMNEYGIIELFNPAAEKIFGYTAEEVVGRNIDMLLPELHHSKHEQYIENYLKTGLKKIMGGGQEAQGKRKNGMTFPMELAVSEMNLEKECKFVGIITDITERKAAEHMLIRAKKQAEESNRLKSEFLNAMSHELRTPLTVMLGNVPLLTNLYDLPQPEDIVDIARDIEEAGKHLLTLISDLLDISKIEADKMLLHRKPVSAEALIEEAMSSIQTIVREKGLVIETHLQSFDIFVDQIRLKQILLNLLNNAVKFTDRGKITITLTHADGMAYLSIADTGCGIRKEDIPFIFDVFRQVDSSAPIATGGTGLGLAITKKLVEMHDGHISVESEFGQGSVFTFSIPIEGN